MHVCVHGCVVRGHPGVGYAHNGYSYYDHLGVIKEGEFDASGAGPFEEGGEIACAHQPEEARRHTFALGAMTRQGRIKARHASQCASARATLAPAAQRLEELRAAVVQGEEGGEGLFELRREARPAVEELGTLPQPAVIREPDTQRVAVADVASVQVELGEGVAPRGAEAHRVDVVFAAAVLSEKVLVDLDIDAPRLQVVARPCARERDDVVVGVRVHRPARTIAERRAVQVELNQTD